MQSAAQSGLNINTPQQYYQMSSVARQSLGQCYILQYLHWPFFVLLGDLMYTGNCGIIFNSWGSQCSWRAINDCFIGT